MWLHCAAWLILVASLGGAPSLRARVIPRSWLVSSRLRGDISADATVDDFLAALPKVQAVLTKLAGALTSWSAIRTEEKFEQAAAILGDLVALLNRATTQCVGEATRACGALMGRFGHSGGGDAASTDAFAIQSTLDSFERLCSLPCAITEASQQV